MFCLIEHLSYRTKAFGSLLNVQCHISIFFVPTCFPDFLPCTVCSNAQPPTLSFLFLTSAINPVCFGKHGILCLSVPLGNMTGVCISSGDQRGKDSWATECAGSFSPFQLGCRCGPQTGTCHVLFRFTVSPLLGIAALWSLSCQWEVSSVCSQTSLKSCIFLSEKVTGRFRQNSFFLLIGHENCWAI